MKTPRPVRPLALSGSLLLVAAALLVLVIQRVPQDAPRPAPARTGPLAEEPRAIPAAGQTSPGGAVASNLASPPERVRSPAVAAPDPTDPPASASPPGVAGMVIGLDPETGAWGPPTPEQLRELAELRRLSEADARRVAKPDGPLPEVRHPDGHVSVELDGQFQEFTTIRIGPDGKPVFTCAHGPDEAARAIEATAAPSLEER